MKAATAFSAS